jgi:hypothetical protein
MLVQGSEVTHVDAELQTDTIIISDYITQARNTHNKAHYDTEINVKTCCAGNNTCFTHFRFDYYFTFLCCIKQM